MLRERIRRVLARIEPRSISSGFTREAAVLMPVFERAGAPHFLLIRRTYDVPTHKGQIAFPGGGRQAGESMQAAALRETYEEVGVPPDAVELLGRWHEYVSSTGYRVVPFAGFLTAPIATTIQEREVAEVLEVPFAAFADPAARRIERMFRAGEWADVPFVSFEGREIWGLTARIILDFLGELDR